MKKFVFWIVLIMLFSCSKDTKDYIQIKLVIDDKVVVDEKKKGIGIEQLSSTLKDLWTSTEQACEGKNPDKTALVKGLRQFLESNFKMNSSAVIELDQFEAGSENKSGISMARKSSIRLNIEPGKFACSSTIGQ